MSSNSTCCGCWPAIIQGLPGSKKTGRTYRRAKYNEREYSIEFENLIEEEDFYAPAQHAVTEVERDLLSQRKFGELLQHENDIIRQQDAKLREKEENARLEDEAYIQAKKEASRVARQAMKNKMSEKSKFPNMNKFDSVEFSKWLSEEKIDITSPELDIEDFESFLEKVRAKSAQALEEEGKKKDANVFEQTLSQGLAATKIAGDALNALQPVELHAVGVDIPSFSPTSPNDNPTTEHVVTASNHPDTSTQLLDIPDVEIKSSDTPAFQNSQVPVTTVSPMVDLSLETSSIPFTGQSNASVFVDSVSVSSSRLQVVDTSPAVDTSETLVMFSSGISETTESNPVDYEPTPLTQTILNTEQCPLDTTQEAVIDVGQPEKLIDISPMKDSAQPIAVDVQSPWIQNAQCVMTFDNHSFDGPLHMNEKGPDESLEPVEKLPDAHVSGITNDQTVMTIPNEATMERGHGNSGVPVETIVTIETPRNIATNLQPIQNNNTNAVPASANGVEVQSFKMVTSTVDERKSSVNELNVEALEDSLNDDDEFNDFDDEFVTSNSNGGFEDYLT